MHPTEKEPNRRAVLLAGAAAGTTAALGAVGARGRPGKRCDCGARVPQAPSRTRPTLPTPDGVPRLLSDRRR